MFAERKKELALSFTFQMISHLILFSMNRDHFNHKNCFHKIIFFEKKISEIV